MKNIQLNPGAVTLANLRAIWKGAGVSLSAGAYGAIDAAADSIACIVASGKTVYGVNTGFGLLASTRIGADRLAELQRNLVMSHSCGLGEALPRRVVRLVMALKVIDVIGSGNQAAVWFENTTPQGVVQTCDWVRIGDDMIKEIRSFYDSTVVREVLSPAEQKNLDGSS